MQDEQPQDPAEMNDSADEPNEGDAEEALRAYLDQESTLFQRKRPGESLSEPENSGEVQAVASRAVQRALEKVQAEQSDAARSEVSNGSAQKG